MGVPTIEAAPKAYARLQAESAEVVNINKASAEELQTVRGIGPSLAERIVATHAGSLHGAASSALSGTVSACFWSLHDAKEIGRADGIDRPIDFF